MSKNPVLCDLFPVDLKTASDRFALYLTEALGGPKVYWAKRGKTSLACRHAHLLIGPAEREHWLLEMNASLAEIDAPNSVKDWLCGFFDDLASSLTDPFLHLYRLTVEELRTCLNRDPGLALGTHHGRTLLIEAARNWDPEKVQLLLERGATANHQNLLGHDALYYAANAVHHDWSKGIAVVDLLVDHGADPNIATGKGRLTPLHAAARRGSLPIVRALVGRGSDPSVQDARRITPIQRAIHCRKHDTAEFLRCSIIESWRKES